MTLAVIHDDQFLSMKDFFGLKIVKFDKSLFTLVSKFHCIHFSSIKKIVFTGKRYLLKFNSIKWLLLLIKLKQTQKDQNKSE